MGKCDATMIVSSTKLPMNTPQKRTDWISTATGQFRLAAIAEAWSWAGLVAGMFFKYVAVHDPIGVQIMGPIHGGLFVIYLVAAFRAAKEQRWSASVTVTAIAVAVPPFATWIFERWALKRGLLGAVTT